MPRRTAETAHKRRLSDTSRQEQNELPAGIEPVTHSLEQLLGVERGRSVVRRTDGEDDIKGHARSEPEKLTTSNDTFGNFRMSLLRARAVDAPRVAMIPVDTQSGRRLGNFQTP